MIKNKDQGLIFLAKFGFTALIVDINVESKAAAHSGFPFITYWLCRALMSSRALCNCAVSFHSGPKIVPAALRPSS